MRSQTMDVQDLYLNYKPLLFSIAYRMLGRVTEAEDIVQDAYVTVGEVSLESIRNKKAYLCKIVTNRCIDLIRSQERQRELYVGSWLPEPIITDRAQDDPLQQYIQQDSIGTAFIILLQQLNPVERAVYVLREALEFDYTALSQIVNKTEDNCRQIYHRAKKQLNKHSVPSETFPHSISYQQAQCIISEFMIALQQGHVDKLIELLSDDIHAFTDGGGKVSAAAHPIIGKEYVLKYIISLYNKGTAANLNYTSINGGPGFISSEEPRFVISFDFELGAVRAIYILMNPDKLMHINFIN
jgi:RNA polymerase sigma factor (sigma-70 family)